jgi:hypothetical protein
MNAKTQDQTRDRHELLQRWNSLNNTNDAGYLEIKSKIRMVGESTDQMLPVVVQNHASGRNLNHNLKVAGHNTAGKAVFYRQIASLVKNIWACFHKPARPALPKHQPTPTNAVNTPPIPFTYPVQNTRPLTTPLARAVVRFNKHFNYELHLPIHPETVRGAATLADLYGQPELAEELRTVLTDKSQPPEDFKN